MAQRLLLLALLCAAGICSARAEEREDEEKARAPVAFTQVDDDDRRLSPRDLSDALKRGDVLPLDAVLGAVRTRYPGEIIEVEAERHGARWIYEVKVLDADGRRRKLTIDARTLEFLGE